MQGTIQNRNQFIKAISQQGVPIVGIILLGISGATTYGWMRMASVKQEAAAPVVTPVIQTVTALGQLEPRGTVIKLSAPTSSQGNRVERLLVQEGDHVQAGQIIAILDSHDQRKAAFEEAEEQVNVARAQLEVIKAGAKQGEINAQQAEIERLSAERQGNIAAQVATVARLQSELQNAQTEFNRYQSLYQEGAISASERDSRRLALDTAQKSVQEAQVTLDRIRSTTPQELNKARATLEQIAEVRPVEVRSAQAEVTRAIAARNQAKASFDQSVVRSPINGEVLDIHTQAGKLSRRMALQRLGKRVRCKRSQKSIKAISVKFRLGNEFG